MRGGKSLVLVGIFGLVVTGAISGIGSGMIPAALALLLGGFFLWRDRPQGARPLPREPGRAGQPAAPPPAPAAAADPLAEAVQAHARPAIRFLPRPEAGVAQEGLTFLGGQPVAAPGLVWPHHTGPDGVRRPNLFLGQVAMADLPPGPLADLLPHDGVLHFFVPSAEAAELQPRQTEPTVLHSPGPATGWRPVAPPPDALRTGAGWTGCALFDPPIEDWSETPASFPRRAMQPVGARTFPVHPAEAGLRLSPEQTRAFEQAAIAAERAEQARLVGAPRPPVPLPALIGPDDGRAALALVPPVWFAGACITGALLRPLGIALTAHRRALLNADQVLAAPGTTPEDRAEAARRRAIAAEAAPLLEAAAEGTRDLHGWARSQPAFAPVSDRFGPALDALAQALQQVRPLAPDSWTRGIREAWDTGLAHAARACLGHSAQTAALVDPVLRAHLAMPAATLPRHQMFGDPLRLQGDSETLVEGHLCLMQLVSDPQMEWVFGDAGTWQFWITPANLAVRNWAGVITTFESR